MGRSRHRPSAFPVLATALLNAALLLALPASAAAAGTPRGDDGRGLPGTSSAAADDGAREQRFDPPPRPPRPRQGPGVIRERSHAVAGRAADHIVVRFADGLAAAQEEAVAAALGAPRLTRPRAGRFVRVAVPDGETPESLAARFRAQSSVRWAETDPLVRAAVDRVSAGFATDDPLFDRQWNLQRIGLAEALDRNPVAGANVLVAVIDTGVAYGSGPSFPRRRGPDLELTRFLPGTDLVDGDDEPFDEGSGATATSPRFGHGTFAASIIAAAANNAFAGTGIAPRVDLMAVRVLGRDGFGTNSGVAEGILFAAQHGARVINLSLGGTSGSQSLAEAVAEAHRRGVVLVAAAGNEAEDDEFDDELGRDVAWPARYPQVIAVGATTFAGARATYSNFGPNLDLVAPAGQDNASVGGGRLDGVLATSFLHDPGSGGTLYGAFWATGTSFACPQVAAVAALLVSIGVDDPDAVRAMLQLTARDLFAPGYDTTSGHGELDAAAAHRGLGFTN